MDEKSAIEWARTILEGWPQTMDDLLIQEWDSENEGHAAVVSHLAQIARDRPIDAFEREWAYRSLESRADEIAKALQSGEIQPEDIPPELLAWCFQTETHMVERPARRRGTDPSVNALRNRKMLHIEKRLREELGYTQSAAIAVIAKAANLSDDGVETALKRTRRLLGQTSYGPETGAHDVWGGQKSGET